MDVNTTGYDTGTLAFKPAAEGDLISDALADELSRRSIIRFEQRTENEDVLRLKTTEARQSITSGSTDVVFSWATPFSNTAYVAAWVAVRAESAFTLVETARTATTIKYKIVGLTGSAEVKVNVIGV